MMQTRTLRRVLSRLVLAMTLLVFPSGALADKTGARVAVDETVDAVLAALNEPGLDSPARVKKIEGIARERFDFETMSRLVLKRSWKKFSPEQQKEFVDAFQDHLSNSYGSRINRYEQQSVAITGEREEARGDVTIKTKIVGGAADDIRMDYRMRERSGRWRIIDVKIAGVSLVSNFRSQFKEVLSNGGPEEVLRRLKQKTAEAAS